jgi:hypothetical protein
LSEVPKHFYDSAESRFWGTGYSGANCRGTNKSTQSAGVPLRTGETRWRPDGDCRCASEAIRLEANGADINSIENTCDFAERENKIARSAVRSCSPT